MVISQLISQATPALNAAVINIHHCVSTTTYKTLQQQSSKDKRKDNGFFWRKEP